MNMLGVVLFACFGFVLGDGGITVTDKPVHFFTLLVFALLIEYHGRYIGRSENDKQS